MEKMQMKKFGNNGFTLIEVMIVIAIIGILAAVVIPAFMQGLPMKKLKGASRDLLSYMQNARLEAIKTNTNVRINFDIAAGTYQAESSGPNPAWASGDEFNLSAPVTLADYGYGVAFGTGSAGALTQQTRLEYNNQGMATTTTSDTIYLDNRDNTICFSIRTSLVGGKKLQFYNGISLPFTD